VCADETSCGTSCSEHADCAAGNYCDGTACVPQLTNGEPCASADQCESGECVDTVCCDDVCDGECESCLGGETDGSDGTCAAVTAPTDPALECGFLQACNGAGACADCVTQSVKLESRLDILLLLDRSGSMGFNDPTAMMPKWDIVENALNVLFVDSGWEGVNVGINFFPPTGVGDPASCDVDEYSPLQVSVAALTSEAATLSAAIEAQNPQADHTPIEGALDGTLAAAVAHQMANPSRKVIVVLATDGAPNACDTDEDNIATLAMLAFDNDGIRTYTIAVAGAVLSLLDKIAMAGGTAEAHDITGDTALFVSTMESIRADAFDCTFDISDLSMVDAAAANITLTPDGGTPTLVPRVADVGACGTDPGYFFDNPADPMSVGLCHASCDSVVAAPDTSIDLVLGCPST